MKKITLLLSVFVAAFAVSIAQNGAIIPEMMSEIKEKAAVSNETALINAISANPIKDLTTSRKSLAGIDDNFKYRVKTKGISDQQQSGRCWLFTGLNVLRAEVIEKHDMPKFEFSQNFSFFYDQLEKSNLFLEGIVETRNMAFDSKRVEHFIRGPINDGGQWTTFSNIVEKYGLVPAEVMPETYHSNHTREVSRIIRTILRKGALKIRDNADSDLARLRKIKTDILADVYRVLVLSMGEPPTEFTWRYKDTKDSVGKFETFTPQSFRKKYVDVNFDDYVMLMNDPTRPYEKLYEIEYDRSVAEGDNWKYINLPTDKIKDFAKASIIDGEAMYFSCDVGKYLNKDTGTLDTANFDVAELLGIDLSMSKTERIKVRESGSSHGMSLTAVDTDENGNTTKWLLENSWGADAGRDGFLIMTDQWFDEYMFRLIVHKKHIDKETLKILDTKPEILPPWDPMFAPDM